MAIVNGFFSIGDDKKSIMIDSEGRIIIQSEIPNRTLSIYNLSSGEKQIIIIFARLIFGLNSHEHGIYIIDEPEASLHLAWQKRFVESVQKVDNTIQLIFATHSPEISGKNSNRMVKLTRKINLPIDNQQEGEK